MVERFAGAACWGCPCEWAAGWTEGGRAVRRTRAVRGEAAGRPGRGCHQGGAARGVERAADRAVREGRTVAEPVAELLVPQHEQAVGRARLRTGRRRPRTPARPHRRRGRPPRRPAAGGDGASRPYTRRTRDSELGTYR